jgi:hypothetical protein
VGFRRRLRLRIRLRGVGAMPPGWQFYLDVSMLDGPSEQPHGIVDAQFAQDVVPVTCGCLQGDVSLAATSLVEQPSQISLRTSSSLTVRLLFLPTCRLQCADSNRSFGFLEVKSLS